MDTREREGCIAPLPEHSSDKLCNVLSAVEALLLVVGGVLVVLDATSLVDHQVHLGAEGDEKFHQSENKILICGGWRGVGVEKEHTNRDKILICAGVERSWSGEGTYKQGQNPGLGGRGLERSWGGEGTHKQGQNPDSGGWGGEELGVEKEHTNRDESTIKMFTDRERL